MTPVAHNVSTPELSMISNNDIKDSSSAIVLKPVLTPKQLILEVWITLNKNIDPNIDLSHLKSFKVKNPNRMIIAYLKINSISSKFDQLSDQIRTTVDILVVGETKLMIPSLRANLRLVDFLNPTD